MENRPYSKKIKHKTTIEMPDETLNELFPQVRYFQIHFEYLHELLNNAINKIDALNKQVNQLEKRLSGSMNAREGVRTRPPVFEDFSVAHSTVNEGDTSEHNRQNIVRPI